MRYDLVIIGMGSGGMVAAEFAARLGMRVAVVERGRVGGDCLWTGCVPSKALLASAKAAHTIRHGDHYGLPATDPDIDTAAVFARLRAVQDAIAASDDDPARYQALGVDVMHGSARLAGRGLVEVTAPEGPRRLSTRAALVCTGSRAAVPDIPGLAEAGYLTNETVFELERAPSRLVVVGGGPIAVELAQALRRLGTDVTLLQRADRILERDDPDLAGRLADRLRADGVDLCLAAAAERVEGRDGAKIVHGTHAGEARTWAADAILVATGRRPNVEGLDLEAQGVVVHPGGVETDPSGRTAAGWIWAAGDVTGGHQFTHRAAHDAVRAVRDVAFPGRGRAPSFVPWCTFTDPELAHAGLTEAEAREQHGDGVEVWRSELAHSDRARAEGATEGAVVIVTAKGRVVGAHVLAPGAGEVIHELALAVRDRSRLRDLASLVHVYPTYATSVGMLAGEATYRVADRFRWLVRVRRLLARSTPLRAGPP